MLNRCAYQQQRNNAATGEKMNAVVCPKPRRFCLLNPSINHPIYQSELCESKATTELLDMIFTKECHGAEKTNNLIPSSSPPFFCGSPPSRTPNPVVHDAQFGNEKPSLLSPASPSSSARGSCGGRVNFGQKHPTVRVEGFKCRGISAVA